MAAFTETFVGQTIGNFPTGWTSRWDATVTDWTIQGPTYAEDDRVFRSDGTGSGLDLISYDAINGDANRDNCEILARLRMTGGSAGEDWYLAARASGSAASETGYMLGIDSLGRLSFWRFSAGAQSQITAANSRMDMDLPGADILEQGEVDTFTFMPLDQPLNVRFRVNGTGATVTLQAKIWRDGDLEPPVWSIEYADTDGSRITAAGWCGIARQSHASARDLELDYIQVATNGDTATLVADTSVALRTTSVNAHALLQEGDPVTRVTSVNAHALLQEGDPVTRVTSVNAHAALQQDEPVVRATQLYVQVLYKDGPALFKPRLMVIN